MGQQESDLAAVRQERDFWMEQCQQKEDVQQTYVSLSRKRKRSV